MKFYTCALLMALMAGSCSSSFAEGFPDILKRSAFEEIIGNYYAYDPFLQPGRRGRELNHGHPSEQSILVEQVNNNNNDPTLYSIPPAVTPLESQVRMEFENGSPIFVTRAPTARRQQQQQQQQQFNHLFQDEQFQGRSTENNEEDFDSFINSNHQQREDYPEYPPFLTSEQSVRQQQQLLPSSSTSKTERFPKYVIGIAGEERLDDIFQQPETVKRAVPAARQTIFRGQLTERRPVSDEIILDESPFAKRSLRLSSYDGHRRYRQSRSPIRPIRKYNTAGSIRNPYRY